MKVSSWFSCLALMIGLTGPARAADLSLPKEIQAHYDKINFLAALSTPEERLSVLKLMKVAPGAAADLQGRYGKIRELLQQKDLTGAPIDPDGSVRLLKHDPVYDYTEILESEVGPAAIRVKVRCRHLDESVVLQLASAYDKSKGTIAPQDFALRLQRALHSLSVLKIHQWYLTSDGWKKNPTDVVLLSP